MPKFKKQEAELKTIDNFIYGFLNFSQAQLYKGVGLEKTKGKLCEVYLVDVNEDGLHDTMNAHNAVVCKELLLLYPYMFIAVKLREKKVFKHPKQKQIEKEAEKIIKEIYEEHKDEINKQSMNQMVYGMAEFKHPKQ